MRVVEVVVDTASALVGAIRRAMAQGFCENAVGLGAVLQACPEIDFPAHRPSG